MKTSNTYVVKHKKNNGKSHQIYVWEVINTMSEKLFICEKKQKEGYKR